MRERRTRMRLCGLSDPEAGCKCSAAVSRIRSSCWPELQLKVTVVACCRVSELSGSAYRQPRGQLRFKESSLREGDRGVSWLVSGKTSCNILCGMTKTQEGQAICKRSPASSSAVQRNIMGSHGRPRDTNDHYSPEKHVRQCTVPEEPGT